MSRCSQAGCQEKRDVGGMREARQRDICVAGTEASRVGLWWVAFRRSDAITFTINTGGRCQRLGRLGWREMAGLELRLEKKDGKQRGRPKKPATWKAQ